MADALGIQLLFWQLQRLGPSAGSAKAKEAGPLPLQAAKMRWKRSGPRPKMGDHRKRPLLSAQPGSQLAMSHQVCACGVGVGVGNNGRASGQIPPGSRADGTSEGLGASFSPCSPWRYRKGSPWTDVPTQLLGPLPSHSREGHKPQTVT